MKARTRVAARIALVVVSTALALVLAEGVYRAFFYAPPGGGGDDGWYQRYRHMNETIYMRSPLEGLIYEPRPSSRVEMEYGVAGFDAERRRWDGQAGEEPSGRTTVALIGDSLAWSEFVSVEDSLAHRLEASLGTDRYRVWNFGVSGYDTTEEALYYEHRVRPHDPDVVVLVVCLNDLFMASGPWGRFATDEERTLKDAQDAMFDRVARVRRETIDGVAQTEESEATFKIFARIRALLRRATFDDHYVDEYLIAFDDAARRERMRTAIERLGRAVDADGATAVLVISPMLEDWGRYRWSAIHGFVREAGEAVGFTVVDPLDGWRGHVRPEDLRSPGDALHYGPAGNRALADVVAQAIRAARR
ncbi:MAG: SGNH/GDSL hydrolase family protein [Myxococcales bacterium]|nr:SGNH/GDSL hydrolase family protein [Myxococcales bacterium]